jgi:hypothetical protein
MKDFNMKNVIVGIIEDFVRREADYPVGFKKAERYDEMIRDYSDTNGGLWNNVNIYRNQETAVAMAEELLTLSEKTEYAHECETKIFNFFSYDTARADCDKIPMPFFAKLNYKNAVEIVKTCSVAVEAGIWSIENTHDVKGYVVAKKFCQRVSIGGFKRAFWLNDDKPIDEAVIDTRYAIERYLEEIVGNYEADISDVKREDYEVYPVTICGPNFIDMRNIINIFGDWEFDFEARHVQVYRDTHVTMREKPKWDKVSVKAETETSETK